ncbi:MAG TPA: nucleotidyltransferase family protein [Chitinophagaceae bacterium]|nr:nucleotidyltransferase family protein [Chitinophagaceae bacterium]
MTSEMVQWIRYTIPESATVRQAMEQLNSLGLVNAVLFATGENHHLLGSVTDGDIRRGFLLGVAMDDPISRVIHFPCHFITGANPSGSVLESFREAHIRFIPVINGSQELVSVLDLELGAPLPLDVILMAGGQGKRLLPLTADLPKPMLKIGSKPILEHNIDRLIRFGITEIHLSIHYRGDQIRNYFGDGSSRNLRIRYIEEPEPMGTIGSVSLISDLHQQHILIMNADLLTTIDFADFYQTFLENGSDICVASSLYNIEVPYAILETDGQDKVVSLAEKPTYTYYSNAGIYLVRKSLLDLVPKGGYFDITDLMEKALETGRTITHYPILGYWLDIGKMQDYLKAQEDIKHLKL